MNKVLQHIHRIALLQAAGERTDGQLLESFVRRRETAALEALVRRHSPMVWGVCGRILHNHHDAEDAFQATFLVLVRKAATVKPREMVGNWLYGVARQTALKARATTAKRRRTRERQAVDMPEPAVEELDLCRDLLPVLDQELSRLPDKYRVAIVMCDLEGKTRKEAARQLGCPEGTMAGRLTRGRIMLAKRLTGRGVVLSGGALAAALSQQASAVVPISVAVSTIKAATLLAAGKAAATGAISVKVAALTEGVMKAMLLTKLKTVLAVVLILGFVATGATIFTCRTAAGQEDKPPVTEKPVKASAEEQDKEGFTAWGREAGGMQAGLGCLPGQHRTYYTGETVTLVVRVRNVSKEAVKFQYIPKFFVENAPTVTDGEGKQVHVPYGVMEQTQGHSKVDVSLAPGKEIKLGEVKLLTTSLGSGKFTLQYDPVFQNTWGAKITLDSALSKLATGKLELEVKDAEKAPQKQEPEKKEGFTAWGKEAGGLQAGLGFRPGERRAYHHGEMVTLVVRVRNVGKETVKFSYIQPCIERTMLVTDGDGKAIYQPVVIPGDLGYRPEVAELSAGKEIDLYELKRQLRPAGEGRSKIIDKQPPYALYGTGNVQLQYDKLVPQPTDKILGDIATGKLELEIKPEAAPKDDNKANKAVNPRVSIDKTKATVEGRLDEASTLVLRIGEEKDKLFWEARRKDTPGSAMVRFSEEGAKRFWGDKAQSAGAFKAVVELTDKMLMSDGKFATGFIYSVAISEGAATEKQSLIGSIIYVPIPKTGSLQDFLARSLAGDAMPFGQLSLREESKVVRKDGVVTFADVRKGDGKLVPVSFVMEKSHSSLRMKTAVEK